jgi:hypothetical protein
MPMLELFPQYPPFNDEYQNPGFADVNFFGTLLR